jgi:eukaryotic-like serine/threonine-protein kinase
MPAVGTGRLVAGRYRLQRPIGRGAMGVVWRGRDELLDRVVAVKQVRITALMTDAESETSYQRTLREAKTAARLSHPGVVTIFDVVEEDGGPWIVMELVQARSLDQIIAEDGPLPPLRAARLGEILVSALACAHAAGVLHRDVKPSNVLLEPEPDGRAVLTDFGIAKMEGDPSLTQVGMVVGTPGFTAPERVCGQPATPASDLWSLGATLYAAVEGRGPFDRTGGSTSIMAGVAAEEAPRAPSAGALGPVIDALLRRDPLRRPDAAATARMLAHAADRLEQTVQTTGAPPDAGPDFMDSAPFADVREFPEFPSAAAELPASLELPGLIGPPGAAELRASLELPAFLDMPAPGGAPGSPFLAETAPGTQAIPEADISWDAEDDDDAPTPAWRRGRGRVVLAAIAAVVIGGAGAVGFLAFSGSGGAGSSPGAAASRAAAPSGGLTDPGGGRGGRGHGFPGGGNAPAGFRFYRVSPATGGTTAGFRIAIPQAWSASTQGPTSVLNAPTGGDSIRVSLASFAFANPLREAHSLQVQALAQGTYPGYQLIAMLPTRIHGSQAAAWRFSWLQPGVGRTGVLELLFRLRTGAGIQAYTLAVSAPRPDFATARMIFMSAVRTFRPLP